MSSETTKKSDKIVTYDPDLKLSVFKKFQMKYNIKKDNFKNFRKINKNWIFCKDFISDVFIYSLCGTLIMLPFSSDPMLIGLSIGTGIWLYVNRIHDKLKEVLGSITLVNNIRYSK